MNKAPDSAGKSQKKGWGWGKWTAGRKGLSGTDRSEDASVSSTSTPNSPSKKQKAQHPSSPHAQSPNHPHRKSPRFGVNNLFRRGTSAGVANTGSTAKAVVVDPRKVELVNKSAWYEDDIRERQQHQQEDGQYLSDDDLRALELFDKLQQQRRKQSGSGRGDGTAADALTIEELEELVELADARRQIQQDEAELEILLERQERGDPDIDTNRMYLLGLLTRQRRGEELEQEEFEDLETLLEQRQDEEELQVLLSQKEAGEDYDDGRLYELELLDRKRRGDPMTDEQSRDVQLLELRRTDAKVDAQDFLELSQRKEDGETLSSELEDRFAILTLIDCRQRGEELAKEDEELLNDYYDARDEEHLDNIELANLTAKKERGDADAVDDERVYELDLVDRQRRGEELSDEEMEDLVGLQSRREQRELQGSELADLLKQKEDGNLVDEYRVKYLQLLDRKRRGEVLAEDDVKLIDEEAARELAEKEELDALLQEKEKGNSIDENRLYELDLFNRKRSGEELNDDELMEFEMLQMQRIEEREASRKKDEPRPAVKRFNDDAAKSVRTVDEISLTSSEIRGREQLKVQLAEHGLPITITFSPGKVERAQMSWVSHGDESYVEDLLNQRENREAQRKEEALEEALELYQVALQEQNIVESEELFVAIFGEVLNEKNEESREKDQKADETLERELELRELRKNMPPPIHDEEEIVNHIDEYENDKLATVDEVDPVESVESGELEVDNAEDQSGQDIDDHESGAEPASTKLVSSVEVSVIADDNSPDGTIDSAVVGATGSLDTEAAVEETVDGGNDIDHVEDMVEDLKPSKEMEPSETQNTCDSRLAVADDLATNIDSKKNGETFQAEEDDQTAAHLVNENKEIGSCQHMEESLPQEKNSDAIAEVTETVEESPAESSDQSDTVEAVDPSKTESIEQPDASILDAAEEKSQQEQLRVSAPITPEEPEQNLSSTSIPASRASPVEPGPPEGCPVYHLTPSDSNSDGNVVKDVPSMNDSTTVSTSKLLSENGGLAEDEKPIIPEEVTAKRHTEYDSEVNNDQSPTIQKESDVERESTQQVDKTEASELEKPIYEGDHEDIDSNNEKEPLQSPVADSMSADLTVSQPDETNHAVASPIDDDVNNGTTEIAIKKSEDLSVQHPVEESRLTPAPSLLQDASSPKKSRDCEVDTATIQDQLNVGSPIPPSTTVALTDGELAEFNHLLDAQERGEAVDEDRIYELELVDRYSLGDELNVDEKADLRLILKERDQFQRYTKEYNELLDLQENGAKIDDGRLYCLELVVRKRLGESLTEDELSQLASFEHAEQQEKEYGETGGPIPNSGSNLPSEESENEQLCPSDALLNDDGFRKGSEEPLTLLEEVEEEELSESNPSQPTSQLKSSDALVDDVDNSVRDPTALDDNNALQEDEELDRLLDLQASGDVVDEQRIYELELLQRQRNGETLTAEEIGDLEFIQESRRRFESYSVEYRDLIERKGMDESFDSQRLFNLELVVRSGMGESLTEDEFDALQEFEIAEEERLRSEEIHSPIPSTVDVSDDNGDDPGTLNEDDEFDNDENRLGFDDPMDQIDKREGDTSEGGNDCNLDSIGDVPVSTKIDEKRQMVDPIQDGMTDSRSPLDEADVNGSSGEEKPNEANKQLGFAEESNTSSVSDPLFPRTPLQVEETEKLSDLEESPRVGDDDGVKSPVNSSLPESKPSVKEDILEQAGIAGIDNQAQSTLKLENAIDNSESGPENYLGQVSTDEFCATEPHPEYEVSVDNISVGRDGSISCDSHSKENTGNKKVESMLAMSSEDVTLKTDSTSECGQASWDQSSFDTDRKDEGGGLTRLEQEEFDELVEKQNAGEPVDEERLYELDLMERHGRNEALTPEELEDLDFIKESRRRLELYHQEYVCLRDRMENGEAIDEERLHVLGLIEKRRNGDDLTEDELCEVEDFEMEEEERSTESDAVVDLHESHSVSQGQSMVDVVGEARNRALDLLSADSVTTLDQPILSSLKTDPDPDPVLTSDDERNTMVMSEETDVKTELDVEDLTTESTGHDVKTDVIDNCSDVQTAIETHQDVQGPEKIDQEREDNVDAEILETGGSEKVPEDLGSRSGVVQENNDTTSKSEKVDVSGGSRWRKMLSFGSKKEEDADADADAGSQTSPEISDKKIAETEDIDRLLVNGSDFPQAHDDVPFDVERQSSLSKIDKNIDTENDAMSPEVIELDETQDPSVHAELPKDGEDKIDQVNRESGEGDDDDEGAEDEDEGIMYPDGDVSFDGHFSLTESEQFYEDSLFDRKDAGETLSSEEMFELDLFSRRREGKLCSAEESEELSILHERHREERNDELELAEMNDKVELGESVDEERMYQLDLLSRFRRGEELTHEEGFELDAFVRLRSGEELSSEDLEDLELLKEQRQHLQLEYKELLELKSRRDNGEAIDDDRLFELLVFDKHRSGSEMNERELYAFDLLRRLLDGERLSEEEFGDLDHLKSRILADDVNKQDSFFTGALLDYVSDLKLRADAGELVEEDETYALSLIRRADEGENLTDNEIDALEYLHQVRDEVIEREALRHRKEHGLGYDEDLLYELELLDLQKQKQPLAVEQWRELELFEKRRHGLELTETELGELVEMKRKREEHRLDEEDLRELREQKGQGEDVDEDLFYELELFERSRTGQPLNQDELFEIEMFELIRRGGKLSDDQIGRLEFLKKERVYSVVDKKELYQIRAAQIRGEEIDEDYLYELELFHRSRAGHTLTNEELYELDIFRRRRDGEDITEDELDELTLLKQRRQQPFGSFKEDAKINEMTEEEKEEEDSVYRQDLLDRQMKGQRLDKQEFLWLELLQKRKRNEELLEDELDELAIMRRQKKEKTAEVENTRKLLEKEMRKKQRREEWEQRVREKEERRKQRRREKKLRLKPKKMRKKKKIESKVSKTDQVDTPMPPDKKSEESVTDDNSNAIEIIGMPLETLAPPRKEEPKKGLFGGVFGGGAKKKSKKELELEEMKRQQEELIREQMKALALEHELKELEKEKQLQEQLVQETMEKQAAEDNSEGSSSWETDTQYNPEDSLSDSDDDYDEDEDDEASSSAGSWNSLSSVDESVGVVTKMPQTVPEKIVEIIPSDESTVQQNLPEKYVLPPQHIQTEYLMMRIKRQEFVEKDKARLHGTDVESRSDDGKSIDDSFIDDQSNQPQKDQHPVPRAVTPPPPVSGENNHRIGELNIKPITVAKSQTRKKELSGTLSPTLKPKALTLSAHLKKQQKKRQRNSKRTKGKYGDDLSIGTTELAKTNKSSQKSDGNKGEGRKEGQQRPWMKHEPEDTKGDSKVVTPFVARETPVKLNLKVKHAPPPPSEKEEKIDDSFFNAEVFNRSVFNFNQSTSKLSIADDDSQKSGSLVGPKSGASKEGEDGSASQNQTADVENDGEENGSTAESDSLGSSINTLEMEQYVFNTPDYDQIESRLADKLRNREAEFDSTWENVVADQNVAAQINQRLRERQRARDNGKEKKKKESDEDEIEDFPRLFLFEGEKTSERKRQKLRRKKKQRKLQKKLDRTLSKEFKRAMKEVFESDSEGEYDLKLDDIDEGNDESTRGSSSKRSLRMTRRSSIDHSIYDDEDDGSRPKNDEISVESEISNDFDGGYLKRLQERSLQPETDTSKSENKKHLGQSTHSEDSTDDDDMSLGSDASHPQLLEDKKKSSGRDKGRRNRRKLRRNRNGELVGEGVDPADIYSSTLETMKDKKVFKISDLRKEMEDLTKQAAQAAASANNLPSGIDPEMMMSEVMPLGTPDMKKKKKAKNNLGVSKKPGFGAKQTSFDAAASEEGLFGFGTMNGGGMNLDQDFEEEEAFLTGGNDSGFTNNKGSGSKLSGLGSKLRLSNMNFFGGGGGGDMKTPSKSRRTSPFGNGRLGAGAFSGKPSSQEQLDDLPPPPGAPLDPSSFQEPLPVPESNDVNSGRGSGRTGGGGMMKMMGKGKSMFSNLKIPGKRPGGSGRGGGFMMDDDDDQPDEGGLGLLG